MSLFNKKGAIRTNINPAMLVNWCIFETRWFLLHNRNKKGFQHVIKAHLEHEKTQAPRTPKMTCTLKNISTSVLLLPPQNCCLFVSNVTKKLRSNLPKKLWEARDSEWQWHQLGHMQVCTSLQRNNHTSNPPLSFLETGCPSCHPTNSVKALKAYWLQSNQWNICNYIIQSVQWTVM